MNRAGRIIAVCGLSMALMMPQAAYAAETLSVQVSAREGITTVGNKQSAYDNVAISHVSNYVNIRSEANTSSSIVGKIYNTAGGVAVLSERSTITVRRRSLQRWTEREEPGIRSSPVPLKVT